jgi:hypothetical protein
LVAILINTELNYVLISKYDLKKDETIDGFIKIVNSLI